MSGFLTTHVLDTARGAPAAGLAVVLYRITGAAPDGSGESRTELARMTTNADGRTDGPILPGADFAPGLYELVFLAGDYLRASGAVLTEPPFLDLVPIRFGMQEGHYHVPLLLSPYGYSTYRGS